MLGRTLYADGPLADYTKNLRGQVLESRDGGGKSYVDAYDFKGMPVASFMQLIDDYKITDPNWDPAGTPSALSSEVFETTAVIDALGRPVTMTDPGGNITTHTYDRGGALKTVVVNSDTYVQDIHYDAKGQRQSIWYGNGTKTNYSYDPLNYRLTQLQTIRLSDNEKLQELKYWYDAVGNITQVTDTVQPTIFYDNSMIRAEQKYTYDTLYRLIKAKGREMIGDTTGNPKDNYNDAALMTTTVSPFDGTALQNYTQCYEYDAVGNILSLQHSAGTGSYTRAFTYDSDSNRLESTNVTGGVPTLPFNYTHDTRGNMLTMAHINTMDWNTQSQLSHIARTSTLEAYYQYSGGQRIRKVVEKTGQTEERIYLGSYEIYRKKVSGVLQIERTTVHISDDTGRIAMLEVRTEGDATDDNNTPEELKRFIYSNHLQSSGLELDEDGEIISYEEYHPYGTTSYQAMDSTIKASAKRYRFTGKERDEESGLNYHGARYYAPWLCRWVAVDPLESEYAPQSPFAYCSNNPVNRIDPDGKGDFEFKPLTRANAVAPSSNASNTNLLPRNIPVDLSTIKPPQFDPTAHAPLTNVPMKDVDNATVALAPDQKPSLPRRPLATLGPQSTRWKSEGEKWKNAQDLKKAFVAAGYKEDGTEPIGRQFWHGQAGKSITEALSVGVNGALLIEMPLNIMGKSLFSSGEAILSASQEANAIFRSGSGSSTYDDLLHQVKNKLDFSTPPNGATFWSGENMISAQEWAANNGKYTLEFTDGGKFLDDLDLFNSGLVTNDEAVNLWNEASGIYTTLASGEATTFSLGASRLNAQGNVRTWFRTERVGLRDNKNVSTLTYRSPDNWEVLRKISLKK